MSRQRRGAPGGARLWLNPSAGVAGDMVLAAMLDVGADGDYVRSQLAALSPEGWTLTIASTTRRGLLATSVKVDAPGGDAHRPWSSIDSELESASLDPFVADGARRTFAALATAEAAVHGIDVDEVRFHEVGAVDAIVDIVGSWAALHSLEVDEVHSAPIGLGTGTASMAHGTIPVPAPAALQLLTGLPATPLDHDGETATPTGVALLRTMVDTWGHVPAGTVAASGRGAGSMDPHTHANVVTAVVVETVPDRAGGSGGHAAVVLETNLDDLTPELIGHVVDLALAAGADDAWVTPIVMKKTRPAHQITVLCRTELAGALRELLSTETGTLGVRQRSVQKFESPRHVESVQVHGMTVRVKVGPHGAKPEHDDVVAVALALDLTARQVAELARWAWAHDDPGRTTQTARPGPEPS